MMILEWPCAWNGCKEKLNEQDHSKLKKYCDTHRKEAERLRTIKTREKKRRLKKLLGIGKKCIICKTALTGNNTKFCTKECSNKFFKEKQRQKEIKKTIENYTKKIQVLVGQLK